MRHSRTISAISLNDSKVAHLNITNIAKCARLSLICIAAMAAISLLIAEPAPDNWQRDFITSKAASAAIFALTYYIGKRWSKKNLLPEL